ncbi:MAG TPA: hypothetical protein VKH19_10575 [Gemmatimonadaceae bacterium]|nr:hypothetical protein [Gemmatimonadaceae bacterium]
MRAHGDSLMRPWQQMHGGAAVYPVTLELRPVRYDFAELMEAKLALFATLGKVRVNGFGIDVLRNRLHVMVDTPEDTTRLRAAMRELTPYADAVAMAVGRVIIEPAGPAAHTSPLDNIHFRDLLQSRALPRLDSISIRPRPPLAP